MEPIVATLLNSLVNMAVTEISKNPQGLMDLIQCRHTTADCIQDIWDAVAAGNLAPSAALAATQALAADMERRQQRPAAPQPPDYAQALDIIRNSLEYRALQR